MLIRHADADRDAAACAAIYAPFVSDTVISFEEAVPGEREFAQRMARIARAYPWLVAEDDNSVVGFAYASQHRERAAYRWAADVTVYVNPAHQRRGIGRALYERLLELLRRQGLHVACAGITLPNDASLGLHYALGFRDVGTYRRIGYKCGAWWDVRWCQAELRSADGDPTEPGPPAEEPAQGGPPAQLEDAR